MMLVGRICRQLAAESNPLSSLSISPRLKQLISGDDHQEGDQQKDAANDARKCPGNHTQRIIIFRMADAKGLKQ
jgi:hypothetical protein